MLGPRRRPIMTGRQISGAEMADMALWPSGQPQGALRLGDWATYR